MPIENIISKSFKYAWKNRAFWFYGFWIAFFAGGSSNIGNFEPSDFEKNKGEFQVPQAILDNLGWIIAVIVIIVIISLVIGTVVTNWSSAAIINGAKMLEDSKKVDRKLMGKVGKRTVWEMIILRSVIPFLLILALIAILAIPVVGLIIALQEQGAWVAVVFVVFILFVLIPLFIYLGIIFKMAAPFIVLEKEKPIVALKKSKALIKGRFWWTFLLGLIFGIISGLGSLVGLLIFLPVVIGLILFAVAKLWIGVAIMALLLIPCLIFYLIVAGFFISVTEIGTTLWWFELKKSS